MGILEGNSLERGWGILPVPRPKRIKHSVFGRLSAHDKSRDFSCLVSVFSIENTCSVGRLLR